MTAPEATVLSIKGPQVTILCPYCNGQHQHTVRGGEHHRYAPGCGMRRSSNDRITGYRFQAITTRNPRETTTEGTPR